MCLFVFELGACSEQRKKQTDGRARRVMRLIGRPHNVAVSGRLRTSSCSRPWKPWLTATALNLCVTIIRTNARMAEFIPHAGAPTFKIAIRLFCICTDTQSHWLTGFGHPESDKWLSTCPWLHKLTNLCTSSTSVSYVDIRIIQLCDWHCFRFLCVQVQALNPSSDFLLQAVLLAAWSSPDILLASSAYSALPRSLTSILSSLLHL